jgi:hypothetical protein
MPTGAFDLVKHQRGRGLYAKVRVSIVPAESQTSVVVSRHAYEWLKEEYGPNAGVPGEDHSFGVAAVRGASFALDHLPADIANAKFAVTIESVRFCAADTTDEQVAYASCFAVWNALRTHGTLVPEIVEGTIRFPSK